MPALLFNTRKIQVPGKFLFALPHRIDFHFLPPVDTIGLTRDDLPALKEKVFNIMWDYYTKQTGHASTFPAPGATVA